MRWFVYLICLGLITLLAGCQQPHLAADACINNLRQIQSAKTEWAQENGKTANDVPTWDEINRYIGKSRDAGPALKCPAGGTYTLNRVGENPTCSIVRHRLP